MTPSNIEEAQKQLKTVRKKQAELVELSRQLRAFIDLNGGNSSPYPDNSLSNKAIYSAWKSEKKTLKQLAIDHNDIEQIVGFLSDISY